MGQEASILNYVIPKYFFAAFFLGLLYSLLTSPTATVLMKHPTPFNAENLTYRDRLSNCYRYKPEKVSCPSDRTEIVDYEFVT